MKYDRPKSEYLRLLPAACVVGGLLGLVTIRLFAQTTVTPKPLATTEYQIRPQAVPSTATDIVSGDAYLVGGTLTTGTSASACTIQDKQGTPIPIMNALAIAANTVYNFQFSNRWMPGGITWSCTAATSGYFSFRQ